MPVGCTVGEGSGAAKGSLYVKNCEGTATSPSGNKGRPGMPDAFDLNPNFFVGEPIEDVKPEGTDNRILVRHEDAGKRLEDSDVLIFDMDSFPVAQCLRGVPAVLATAALQAFCAYLPGKTWPRLRVGRGFPVRANLALHKSCPGNPYVIAEARGWGPATAGAPPEQWNSWIELREFGEATMRTTDPVQDVKAGFRVEFGERLFAESFHLDLDDAQGDARRDRSRSR